MSKYRRWYAELMLRAANRKLAEPFYSERHHITPKSLGGSDDPVNLVDLTYREHFLAHWLLTKFVVGADKHKMVFALLCMTMPGKGGRVISGWQYDVARRAVQAQFADNEARRRELRRKTGRSRRYNKAVLALEILNSSPPIGINPRFMSRMARDLLRADHKGLQKQRRRETATFSEQLHRLMADNQ